MAQQDHYIRIEKILASLLESVDIDALDKTKQNFILALRDFHKKANYESVAIPRKDVLARMNDYAQSKKDEITKSGFTKFLSRLKSAGATNETKVPGSRAVVLEFNARIDDHFVNKQVDISLVGHAQEHARSARVQRDLFDDALNLVVLDIPHSNYAMRLMSGILQGFIRSDRYDRRKTIPRTQRHIRLRNNTDDIVTETIEIKTTCRSDDESQLMEFSDSVIIAALNSMYVESIVRQFGPDPDPKEIPPLFVFDIFDVCDVLGVSRKNRPHVVARLQRVRDTMFTLYLKDAPEFKRLFNFGLQDVVEYQYITQFGFATEDIIDTYNPVNAASYSENKENADNDLFGAITYDNDRGVLVNRVPRFYYISFNTYHFSYLIKNRQEHRFTYPPELLKSKNPALLSQAYSWARGYIGVRPDAAKGEAVTLTFDEYRNHIAPVTTREMFFKLFKKMIERYLIDKSANYSQNSKNIANVMGYIIEVDHTPERISSYYKRYPSKRPRTRGPTSRMDAILTIKRDINDPYVGDDSLHNQLLRQGQYLT